MPEPPPFDVAYRRWWIRTLLLAIIPIDCGFAFTFLAEPNRDLPYLSRQAFFLLAPLPFVLHAFYGRVKGFRFRHQGDGTTWYLVPGLIPHASDPAGHARISLPDYHRIYGVGPNPRDPRTWVPLPRRWIFVLLGLGVGVPGLIVLVMVLTE